MFVENDGLNEIRHKNIINYIKAQRLSWFGHLHRMPEERMVKRVYKWKPMLTRPLGRPENRWEDMIYIYYLQLGCHPVAVHIYTQTIHRTTQQPNNTNAN